MPSFNKEWAMGLESGNDVEAGSMGYVGLVVLAINILLYAYLARAKKRW
jgi:hypothetical protein